MQALPLAWPLSTPDKGELSGKRDVEDSLGGWPERRVASRDLLWLPDDVRTPDRAAAGVDVELELVLQPVQAPRGRGGRR